MEHREPKGRVDKGRRGDGKKRGGEKEGIAASIKDVYENGV